MDPSERKLYFDALYRAHADSVYRYCCRLCGGDRVEAEDIAQETFIRAYRGLDDFGGRSAVRTWLYRIALNRWLKRRRPGTLSLDYLDESRSTPDPAPARLTRIWLERALAGLSDPLRVAVILVKAEGLSHREAAEVLGVPVGTVQRRVHEGLIKLRRQLLEEGGVAGMMPALRLGGELRGWQPATAPHALAQRVYESLSLPAPQPVAGPAASPGSGVTRGQLVRRVALGGATAGALVVGGASLPRAVRATRPPTAGQRIVSAMGAVRTARARGTFYKSKRDVVTGRVRTEPDQIEYWYASPNRYRKHIIPLREPAPVTGLQLESYSYSTPELGLYLNPGPGGEHRIQLDGGGRQGEMIAFAAFTSDSDLGRALEALPASEKPLRVDAGSLDSEMLQARKRDTKVDITWTLTFDPVSHRVREIDYLSRPLIMTELMPTHILLNQWDYGLPVPDSVFEPPSLK